MSRLLDITEYTIDKGRIHYVYSHTRIDINEIFYIGIGTVSKIKNLSKIYYKRAYQIRNRNSFWENIVNKTDYKINIVCESYNLKSIKEIEKQLIDFYGRRDLKQGNLVNLTNGGESNDGYIRTSETNKKHSNTLKGKKPSEACFKGLSVYNKNIPKEILDKIRKSKQKQIIDINTNEVYESIGKLAEKLGIAHSTLSGYLLGKRKNNKFKNFKYLKTNKNKQKWDD